MSHWLTINSNLHLAVARMDIAADNGDGKLLTNGVVKEEVGLGILDKDVFLNIFQPKGLPYTAEQWAPHNPDGEIGVFLFLRFQNMTFREKAIRA